MDDHRQVGGLLGRGHAEVAHFLRQFRQRLRDAILHLHLRHVHVRAQLEGDGQRHHAVGRGLGKHVKRILDAVDGLFQGRCDGFGDGLGIGSRILGLHHHGGRNDFRIFADGQFPEREQADQKDDGRENAGENGPANEKIRKIHGNPPSRFG